MTAQTFTELRQIRGVGEKRYAHIIATLEQTGQTLNDLLTMDAAEIKAKFKLPINTAQSIADWGRSRPKAVQESRQKAKTSSNIADNILTLTPRDAEYPLKLINVLGDKAPQTLHIWGNLDLLNRPSVGFCGSRSVSDKGIQVVEDAVEQIVELGWVVVSGHAKGVDTAAHLTALENGGSTIIVAAEGISTFKLRQEIKKIAKPEHILIVSEFQPNDKWTAGRAMQRNKTIIGLSDAMVLIESRMEGGTFDAGKTTLKLNMPLFVAQYEMSAESNAGNSYFLQRGATALLKSRQTGRANLLPLRDIISKQVSLDLPLLMTQLPMQI